MLGFNRTKKVSEVKVIPASVEKPEVYNKSMMPCGFHPNGEFFKALFDEKKKSEQTK